MFNFLYRKRVALLCILLLPTLLPAQNRLLTLSDFTDSADHYLPRLMEKRALVSSAASNVTDTRHQFLPNIRFNDQVNIGTDNSLPGS